MVGKVIYKELCKKFIFGHTTKMYTHSPESVRENKADKIIWDFEIQIDHLIPKQKKQKQKTTTNKRDLPE